MLGNAICSKSTFENKADNMSHVVRNSAFFFAYAKNKGTDQLYSIMSSFKSDISNLQPSAMPGSCLTWLGI